MSTPQCDEVYSPEAFCGTALPRGVLWKNTAWLSFMDGGFDKDYCGGMREGCNLVDLCEAGADECEVDVHLPGKQIYYMFLFSLTKGDVSVGMRNRLL